MKNRADEIKRRHEARKKQRRQTGRFNQRPAVFHASDEAGDRLLTNSPYSDGEKGKPGGHPLARKEWMALRMMVAVALFLGVGILFKNPAPAFGDARAFIQKVFQTEFQFAMVADWYKDQFGEPLALFPTPKDNEMKAGERRNSGYAVPVSGTIGTIKETFADNGQGIMVETASHSTVQAVKQGMVSFVGKKPKKPELGKVVVIQHYDGSVSWYGKLKTVDVELYDFVKRGEKIGTVMPSEDGESGTFYFALKQGDTFVNPLKVIDFE
ncbi:MAG TPA: M23 family metallopeptidase [Bacillales bacterium]|nr:M23 family metallopeptidase [Bacillales bacterium]